MKFFISDTYKEWYGTRFPAMGLEHFPCHYYYMTPVQQQMLIENYKNGVPLPEGYYFDKADVEKDAQVILNTWRHAASGDLETTKAKLQRMPNSLVREKQRNEAISFELVDLSGFMNHLFTLPEHRNKGIGSAVETDLCIKLIKEGIVPYKDVETFNKSVLAASEKSKYWTRWNSANDEPILVNFYKHVFKTPN
uniref:Glycine N-acyltransferase-like protein n=1 Tax=Panagrolaimus superbus TaxID=310955 RepID=A0A914Z099_9BILA